MARLPTYVMTILILMSLSPFVIQLSHENQLDNNDLLSSSSSTNATISPISGWTTGGENITITGSGFLEMAFKNVSSDGKSYSWTTNTINYVTGAGYSPSVVVDSNGTVHIVHVLVNDNELWHSKLTSGSSTWIHDKIMDCNGCREADMTIDSNDNLHLAFYLKQEGTTGYLYYGTYNGSIWDIQSLQNNVYANQIRIVLDANDRPHISYANSGYICNGAMLKYHDGSNWITQAIDTTTTYVGCDTSLAIDKNGHVHVAYRHHSNMDQMIGSNISGTWQRYTIDNGNDVGYHSDIVVDNDNNLQILYRTNAGGGQYKYAQGLSGSAWSISTSSGGYGDFRMHTDTLGNIHASMYDSGSDDLAYQMLMPGSGNTWNISTVDSAGNVGYEHDIFVDENNMIHIAYYDSSNQRLKYANKSTGMYLKKEITVDFGTYGMVTGSVINDTTIVVSTPPAGTVAETVNLSLWGEDGNEHPIGVSFLFISPDDIDMDGVLNVDDDCPSLAGNSSIDQDGCPDSDGDGYSDENDAFPIDSTEWLDSDNDGYGDNIDVFPNNSGEWIDSDNDSVGDNSDAFPFDSTETLDSDNDGVGDNADVFPLDENEYLDSDLDGVGDNGDAFPYDANETTDSDSDGVGDNADAFPNDPYETTDSDGDGIGDNSDIYPYIHNFIDSDSDGSLDIYDKFPTDHTQSMDSDGDGYGDNASGNMPDAFPNIASQWSDIDGDGYGDNWGNSTWNDTLSNAGIGQYIEGAVMADYCPQVNGNSSFDGFFGCLDKDGDGIPNIFDDFDDYSDEDGDGIIDQLDQCLGTSIGVEIDAYGCEIKSSIDETQDKNSDGLLSSDKFVSTIGFGAVIITIFTFLQTNLATALLPETFRWVQVFRRNNSMTKEEANELTYLQSLVQAYYQEPETLYEELRSLKSDLSGRYTNNELKKSSRDKVFSLIDSIINAPVSELFDIAHSETYFGLTPILSVEERIESLQEDIAMSDIDIQPLTNLNPEISVVGAINPKDGHEWLEYPTGSGKWFVRDDSSKEWSEWKD